MLHQTNQRYNPWEKIINHTFTYLSGVGSMIGDEFQIRRPLLDLANIKPLNQ